MATQPPARPWFRLGSMIRPSTAPEPARPPAPTPAPARAPAPAPAPAPVAPRPLVRPAFIRPPMQPPRAAVPVTSIQSAPPSPPPQASASPTTKSPSSISPLAPKTFTVSSMPSSPATKAVPPPPLPTIRVTSTSSTHLPSPTSNPPMTIKPASQATPQSPRPRTTAPPPSPLTPPPSQVKPNAESEPRIPKEAEQKTVLVQKTVEKPNHKHNGISQRNDEVREKGIGKKLTDSDNHDMDRKVITIAGENKGAFMEVVQSPKKHEVGKNLKSFFKKGSSKTEKNGSSSSSSSNGEETPKEKKDKAGRNKAKKVLPMKAFMNSNVQGVNSSIMYNSSCTHHDPGVHFAFLCKPAGGGCYEKVDHNTLEN